MKNNPDELAAKLNDEYSKNKFSNKNEYVNYVKKYIEKWKNAEISFYEVHDCTYYKDYVCIDKENNYYIFRQQNDDYSIILDLYTLNFEWQEENYNKADESEKIEFIIEKIVNMINCGDYEELYNKMSENFKESNFKTLEEFENYANQHFKENSSFNLVNIVIDEEMSKFEVLLTENSQEDLYTYAIMTTVLKAKDLDNFIIAFKVEEG